MSERWLDIARKDFQYARRSLLVLAVVFIFTFLTLVIVAVPGLLALAFEGSFDDVALLFRATRSVAGLVIPIIALIAAYLSVAGERQTGRIRLLLGMPPTRLDVVVGKFLARSAIIVLAIVVAYAAATVVSLALYQTVPVTEVLWTVLLTCLLGMSFVSIAVGISASTGSRAIAMALSLAVFVVSVVLWPGLIFGLESAMRFALNRVPEWVSFLDVLPPTEAYSELFSSLVGADDQLAPPTANNDAFYRTDVFLFALLGMWIVLPVTLGYLLFERTDLS